MGKAATAGEFLLTVKRQLVEPVGTSTGERKSDGGIRTVSDARTAASLASDGILAFLAAPENVDAISTALRIRAVESCLYDLFGKGKLHGTIHTCLGQEFTGALLARHLRQTDFITSNHRCHGHFIAACGNWGGLIDEIVGNGEGVCGGIGSSQHLWATNFMSNGQQGGMLPVAAGMALSRKHDPKGGAVVSFIGEGTLGEGVVYETFNLMSLWGLPQVIVCENNFYSQSTEQSKSVAGDILARARAFGVDTYEASTWDLTGLDRAFDKALSGAREAGRPAFILVSTYRLNPHSKGDDLRDPAEISQFRGLDPLTLAVSRFDNWRDVYAKAVEEAAAYAEAALLKAPLDPARYLADQLPRRTDTGGQLTYAPFSSQADGGRIVSQLNAFYRDVLGSNPGGYFLGEDIEDPYGGAFKVSKGLTDAFPNRVITTPISEAAITGVGVGLSLSGNRAFVEIMFGDFITYAFDQIVNNASKFHHMYNGQASCPVVVRAPMGGRRGYGPTHSQSLDRFLIGIDNCCAISLNSLTDVSHQLGALTSLAGPAVLLENKIDYTFKTFEAARGYVVESLGGAFPTVRVRPEFATATVTLVSFGGMARYVADQLTALFQETDVVAELLVPTLIHPLDLAPILESVGRTGRIAVLEEGPVTGSVGAELLAQLAENVGVLKAARVGARPLPIPSARPLEEAALPDFADLCAAVRSLVEDV